MTVVPFLSFISEGNWLVFSHLKDLLPDSHSQVVQKVSSVILMGYDVSVPCPLL